jgi:DNA-binding Lrp family transcriptional regulator
MDSGTARHASKHRRAEYARLGKKTPEREFVEALERDFEMSPRESRGVLEAVHQTFFERRELQPGQIEYTAVHAREGPGRLMEAMEKVRVVLTKDLPSDREVEEKRGEGQRRKIQILRMTEEAFDQDGLLTQEDLGRILGVSSRTIRRDVTELMEDGNLRLYLRGLQRDIGKGVTHKVWIVGLYLEWKTYSEIERMTGHSAGAIKAYMNDFSRILIARERGIRSAKEIGFYIGRTERLVNEYLSLIEAAGRDRLKRERLESLKSQLRHLERDIPSKKRHSSMVWRLLAP